MNQAAQFLFWQVYWRMRWGWLAAATILTAAIVLSHVLPNHWTIRLGDDELPAVGWFLGICCLFVNLLLIAAFGMSREDAREFTFARDLFVIPVSTRALAAWPLISGCVTVAAVWVVNATFVLRPGGIAAPVWWPAATLALALACFQAIAWTPFVQRWLHGALTVAVAITPIGALLLLAVFDVHLNELTATACLLSLIPLVYGAAVSGLARARRGDPYNWTVWERWVQALHRRSPAASHPFRSAGKAQFWYEIRAHFLVLVVVACILPCFLFVPALQRNEVAFGWRLLGMLLAAPLLLAILTGGALGNLVDPTSRQQSSSFVFVRPISCLEIIRAKFISAAVLTVAIWVLFLMFIALLLLRPGFIESIQGVARGVPRWKFVAVPGLILSLLVVVTWVRTVEWLWVGMAGRKWVEVTVSCTTAGGILIGGGGGLWIAVHPELHDRALAAGPWLALVVLFLKLAAAVGVIRGLRQSHLVTWRGVTLMVVGWLAAVVSLAALAFAVAPLESVRAAHVLVGIALFIPFSRLAGAPLALQWNRHR